MSDALEALRGLALRSENAEAVDPLVEELRAEGLPHPGPILTMVLTVERESGDAAFNYIGTPEWAVATLRGIADQVEKDAAERRAAAEELL